jgi:hypothetical protein
MFPLKPRLNSIKLCSLSFLIISFLFVEGILPNDTIAKGTEPVMPKPTVSQATFNQSLKTLAQSPNVYRFMSQHDTKHPTVYCAPTVLAMAFSPYVDDSTPHSPTDAVESFAKELGTCPRSGTTVLQILNDLNHFNAKVPHASHAINAPIWNDVWYQGIHRVPAHYYHNRKHNAQWASLNADVLNALNEGGIVIAHLGWYVEDVEQKRFLRKGGHYVLVTAVYESPDAVGHYLVEILDPLDTVDAFTSRFPRLRLDLRLLSEEKKSFKVVDSSKQFRPRQAGAALFQPTPPPAKVGEYRTFLDGFVVLTKKIKLEYVSV